MFWVSFRIRSITLLYKRRYAYSARNRQKKTQIWYNIQSAIIIYTSVFQSSIFHCIHSIACLGLVCRVSCYSESADVTPTDIRRWPDDYLIPAESITQPLHLSGAHTAADDDDSQPQKPQERRGSRPRRPCFLEPRATTRRSSCPPPTSLQRSFTHDHGERLSPETPFQQNGLYRGVAPSVVLSVFPLASMEDVFLKMLFQKNRFAKVMLH